MVDVTKPILSVSCLCENGVETHLAKESFLRFGDGHEPLISKGGVYFVKAQTVNACVRVDGCTEGAPNPCVQTKKVKNPCVKHCSCVAVRKNDGVEIIHECQRKRACQDVDVKPVVRDPMDDDRVLVESGAEMTPVQHEPSEFEKQKHKSHSHHASKAKHKRKHTSEQRIIEDSELPVIQCDYLMLKDVAGTGGLKVLSMYVRTFGYGTSTVVETKGPTDMFATMGAVNMLNFLGLSDIILQCDPEPSLIKCAESVKSRRTERIVIRSSPRRSHQCNGGVENYQKQLQGQVRTMLAAMQEHTQYRPSADNACKEYISHTGKFHLNGYDENDNYNTSDETKCETNYSITKWNNMRKKHFTKHDTNDDVAIDNCVVHTVR